jgi:hypothetical protein
MTNPYEDRLPYSLLSAPALAGMGMKGVLPLGSVSAFVWSKKNRLRDRKEP